MSESNYNFPLSFYDAQDLVRTERERQISLWGDDSDFDLGNPHKILTVLTEEVGEIARALLDQDEENLIEEITQVAAVSTKWLEAILRDKRARKEDINVLSPLIDGNA